MTRSLSSENYAAIQARRLDARDFLWIEVKTRDTGTPVFDGYWSDVGTITCDVIDPETGGTTSRTFYGAGGLIKISDVPLVSNLTVQNVTITLSQVADRVNDLVRTYECKFGKVQVFRGLFDPATRVMVAPAVPRFVGLIDEAPIKTPKEGETGSIEFTCTSHTQELTRSNSDTRSDASQQLRHAGDDFLSDVNVVGGWQFSWGRSSGTAPATPSPVYPTAFAGQPKSALY